MEDHNKLLEDLKELSDLEFEILFIDNVCKKIKSLNNSEVPTNTLLFMYHSVVESLKKYKQFAAESNRVIHHEDAVNLIIMKGEAFLTSVVNDNSKMPYVGKSLLDLNELVKELLVLLKKELVDTPKYEYLKPKTE